MANTCATLCPTVAAIKGQCGAIDSESIKLLREIHEATQPRNTAPCGDFDELQSKHEDQRCFIWLTFLSRCRSLWVPPLRFSQCLCEQRGQVSCQSVRGLKRAHVEFSFEWFVHTSLQLARYKHHPLNTEPLGSCPVCCCCVSHPHQLNSDTVLCVNHWSLSWIAALPLCRQAAVRLGQTSCAWSGFPHNRVFLWQLTLNNSVRCCFLSQWSVTAAAVRWMSKEWTQLGVYFCSPVNNETNKVERKQPDER